MHIPHLGALLKIIRRHTYLLLLHYALLVEVGFTAVDEDQRIGLAVVPRKVHLLELRRSILMVFTGVLAARWAGGEGGDRLGVGLRGGLEGLDGGG